MAQEHVAVHTFPLTGEEKQAKYHFFIICMLQSECLRLQSSQISLKFIFECSFWVSEKMKAVKNSKNGIFDCLRRSIKAVILKKIRNLNDFQLVPDNFKQSFLEKLNICMQNSMSASEFEQSKQEISGICMLACTHTCIP